MFSADRNQEKPRNIDRMSTMDTYTTQQAFANALDVAKGTMSRYLDRDDWPIQRTPPWTADDLLTVQRWRADHLQENRNEDAEERKQTRGRLVKAPGIPVTWQNLTDEAHPLCIKRWLGADLFAELTLADLQDLAGELTFAFAALMLEAAQARGNAGLLAEAPAGYYYDLLRSVPAARAAEGLNRLTILWAARRWLGVPRWWKRLPDPPDNPPREYLKRLTPLPHRAGKGKGHN